MIILGLVLLYLACGFGNLYLFARFVFSDGDCDEFGAICFAILLWPLMGLGMVLVGGAYQIVETAKKHRKKK